MSHINFDANATLELHPILRGIKLDFDSYLNPSSIHTPGQRSRMLLENTRQDIINLLGLNNEYRVIFTSGATEANNLAIYQGNNIVSSKYEHVSILEPLKNKQHQLLGDFKDFDFKDFDLVSLMQANNETGEIYDLSFIKEKKIIKHTDAVQSVGKVIKDYLDFDMISISAHKIGALPGIGALVVKKELDLKPLILGGSQELFLRAGTENVFGINTFGLVCRTLIENQNSQISKLSYYKELVLKKIEKLPIKILKLENQLCNTIHITVPNILADDLVVACDLKNLCISSGSACASGKPNPSHVLMALGYTEKEAKSSIRISISPFLEFEQVEKAANILHDEIEKFL